jgi:CheY-like chemotaxis protein
VSTPVGASDTDETAQARLAAIVDSSDDAIVSYELIRHVRAMTSESRSPMRAVAVTAHMAHEVRSRGLAAGFDACTTKPLDADDLVELLEALR